MFAAMVTRTATVQATRRWAEEVRGLDKAMVSWCRTAYGWTQPQSCHYSLRLCGCRTHAARVLKKPETNNTATTLERPIPSLPGAASDGSPSPPSLPIQNVGTETAQLYTAGSCSIAGLVPVPSRGDAQADENWYHL